MAIPSVNINPPVNNSLNPVTSNTVPPPADQNKTNTRPPVSATVTLSAEAQKLSQNKTNQTQAASNNATLTAQNQNPTTQSQNTTASSGVQLIQGESKGGRVNTYA
jgi:hypothetical protein